MIVTAQRSLPIKIQLNAEKVRSAELDIRSVAGRARPAYADFSLCCNDKATGPSGYVFCFKEFACPSDQILPAGRLQTYEHNSVMRARLKLAGIRKIQILGD